MHAPTRVQSSPVPAGARCAQANTVTWPPSPPRVTWNVWAEAGKTWSCARAGGVPQLLLFVLKQRGGGFTGVHSILLWRVVKRGCKYTRSAYLNLLWVGTEALAPIPAVVARSEGSLCEPWRLSLAV